MKKGRVVGIFISPAAGGEMMEVDKAFAIAGKGLLGDRYCDGKGSWNKDKPGRRQVTLMNARFFTGSGFTFADSRRNIFTEGVELMRLIGTEFTVGAVRMRGVKYCYPCDRPSALSGKPGFAQVFQDCGGLIAEIVEGGVFKVDDEITPLSQD